MESAYIGFESYNFEEDANYQDGLKRLRVIDESHEHILKFKIFFYNRFVRSIELEGYKQWLASRISQTQTRGDSVLELQDKCDKLCIQPDGDDDSDHSKGNSPTETGLEERRQPISEAPAPCLQTGIGSTAMDPGDALAPAACQSLSFAEVFRLIQADEDVPGLQKLDIRPCQQSPTASRLSRRAKPWENTTAS
ncbi:hypothetical protein AAFF_G00145510 [Aldrovandia affinis]|uniref:Uncharacterized protein n=1 Tax=Aldrovandia affinis TaxID=143900 RepID=A0AAD7T0Q4_9TELE|nr:hypothetical protein AAFF_G00145510 [Aldrovandia affinis]